MTQLFVWLIPIVIVWVLMEWMRKSCKWDPDEFSFDESAPTNFPAIGHSIIFTLFACVPILGVIEAMVLLIYYFFIRCTGKMKLKPTKFNKKFFNVKDNV